MSNATATKAPKSCPVSREVFRKAAKPLPLTIDGKAGMVLSPKEFSTGSFGWNTNEKYTVMIDGVAVPCQLGINLTIIGSKEQPAA